MNKIFGKSCKTILIATLIYILYVAFVVMPFFTYASPPKVALQRPPQKKLNKGLQFDFDRAIIIYQTRPYSSAG